MNRPPGASRPSDASVSSPASEFSTTSTPRPPVAAANRSANPVLRDEAIRSGGRPSPASTGHLASLAVANTSAPRCRATRIAAIPTPPVPAWISTDSPARRPARSTSA